MKLIDADKLDSILEIEYDGKMIESVEEFEAIPTVNAVVIPNGATNGDMIKAMFPKLIVNVFREAKPIPYVMVIGENYEFNNSYPLDWWNAPYKKEGE